MSKLMKKGSWLAILCCVFFLAACGHEKGAENTTQVETIVAKKQTLVTPLFFSGIVSPLRIDNVNSPLDGVITDLFFKYGDLVKKDQSLFTIRSDQLEKDFLASVSEYMKAVDEYTKANRTYLSSKELSKLEFIPLNQYYSDKNARDESYFAMRQSVFHVKRMLEKLGIPVEKVKNLDLTDEAVVERIISRKQDKMIIKSPETGIALIPTKSDGGESAGGEVARGAEIKTGQVLLSLGNMTGLTVKIEVNEVDIGQIKVNQKATVTGPAFAEYSLSGFVSGVDVQAKGGGGTMPTFPVTVTVPKLTEKEQKDIYVGMSAKVEISTEEKDVIVLPITAIFQENGKSMVKLKDKTTGKVKEVPVVIGKTTIDSISVLDGIEAGDIVVYNH